MEENYFIRIALLGKESPSPQFKMSPVLPLLTANGKLLCKELC